MSKHKYIETPEFMLELWEEYKKYVKSNPRYIYQLDKIGNLVPVPHEVPYTQQGFEVYVKNKYKWTIGQYFDNQQNLYNDYIAICSHIVMERKQDQIEGGMVGQYNPSITQRLNGLREATDVNLTSKPILNLDPLSDDSSDNRT